MIDVSMSMSKADESGSDKVLAVAMWLGKSLSEGLPDGIVIHEIRVEESDA